MSRKRLTQVLPFLIPLRTWQRNLFYNISMYFDNNTYSKEFGERLEYEISSFNNLMINSNSGHDIVYQLNKVENIKLVSKTINYIIIKPNETFSFCFSTRNRKKYGSYKNGLVLIDGELVVRKGGGVCQLSNLLYYLFLTSPLTITERHPHKVRAFSNNDKNSIKGIDATVISGWLDLKVKNETNDTYQIEISFDDKYVYGKLLSNSKPNIEYKIINENLRYVRENGKIYECVSVVRLELDKETKEVLLKKKLYDEKVQVNYELSSDIVVEEKENEK